MDMKDDVKTTKNIVEEVLQKYWKARSDNNYLVIKVLEEMGYAEIVEEEGEEIIKIKKSDLDKDDIPTFTAIPRARRYFQEQGLYPAPEEVRKMRAKEEDKMEDIKRWF